MVARAKTAVLVMAGGQGLRASMAGRAAMGELPKQYRFLAGQSVIARSMAAFLEHDAIDWVQPVIASGDEMRFASAMPELSTHPRAAIVAAPVLGGATRQASVLAGLEALAARNHHGMVMVHDAARPFVDQALISRAIAAGRASPAAIPVMPVTDTIKTLNESGVTTGTLPRNGLACVQTPQVFDFDMLLGAHRKAAKAEISGFTDDASVLEWLGMPVSSFAGDPANVKLTLPEDFVQAEARMSQLQSQLHVTRIGQGYDVHRFMAGDHVWIGGVRIEHSMAVEAHSDGDVVLHALTDAILGALAEGDIGVHFSPNDPRWRGSSSDRFLAFAAERVRARNGRIDHLDTTLVCEEPKVGPHRQAIRERIAVICGIGTGQVSIKATTSEQMGFTGRREGLSASAVATISLPRGEAP